MCDTNRIRVNWKTFSWDGKGNNKMTSRQQGHLFCMCILLYHACRCGGTWVVTLQCSFHPSDKTTGICRCFWTVLDPQRLLYLWILWDTESRIRTGLRWGPDMIFLILTNFCQLCVVNYVYSTYFFASCKKVI